MSTPYSRSVVCVVALLKAFNNFPVVVSLSIEVANKIIDIIVTILNVPYGRIIFVRRRSTLDTETNVLVFKALVNYLLVQIVQLDSDEGPCTFDDGAAEAEKSQF